MLSDVMATRGKAIPQELLAKAECVVVVPGMKTVLSPLTANTGAHFSLLYSPGHSVRGVNWLGGNGGVE